MLNSCDKNEGMSRRGRSGEGGKGPLCDPGSELRLAGTARVVRGNTWKNKRNKRSQVRTIRTTSHSTTAFLVVSLLSFPFSFFRFLVSSFLSFIFFSLLCFFFPIDLRLSCVCVVIGTTCNIYVAVFLAWQAVLSVFPGASSETYAPVWTWHIVG